MRYAVYFAPPFDGPLWAFGSSVLGYDAARGRDVAQPDLDGVDAAALRAASEAPRRYGFHATLKAPFHAAQGIGEAELRAACAAFAETHAPVRLEGVTVRALGSFLALAPEAEPDALAALEGAVVRAFEPLRAPLDARTRARRLAGGLTARQATYLERFGYPYVLEEFRFHMTLTGALEDGLRERMRPRLARLHAESAGTTIDFDAIALYAQEGSQARFRALERFPLRSRQA